jgi:hypothetical protein
MSNEYRIIQLGRCTNQRVGRAGHNRILQDDDLMAGFFKHPRGGAGDAFIKEEPDLWLRRHAA